MTGSEDRRNGGRMNWTTAFIVLGIVMALGVALLGFWVLNATGFGPDNDPSVEGEARQQGVADG